ncbi:MAG: hypothetical protein AVDCRST_MAG31-2425, partial [uncultured Sphingomonas sp.]
DALPRLPCRHLRRALARAAARAGRLRHRPVPPCHEPARPAGGRRHGCGGRRHPARRGRDERRVHPAGGDAAGRRRAVAPRLFPGLTDRRLAAPTPTPGHPAPAVGASGKWRSHLRTGPPRRRLERPRAGFRQPRARGSQARAAAGLRLAGAPQPVARPAGARAAAADRQAHSRAHRHAAHLPSAAPVRPRCRGRRAAAPPGRLHRRQRRALRPAGRLRPRAASSAAAADRGPPRPGRVQAAQL